MEVKALLPALLAIASTTAGAGMVSQSCSMQINPNGPNGGPRPAQCTGSTFAFDKVSVTTNSLGTISEQGSGFSLNFSSSYYVFVPSPFVATTTYDLQWSGSHTLDVDRPYSVTVTGVGSLFQLSPEWQQSGSVDLDGVFRGTLNPGTPYRVVTQDRLTMNEGGIVAAAQGARLYSTLTAVAVPEPGTLALLGGGFAAMAAIRRRRVTR